MLKSYPEGSEANVLTDSFGLGATVFNGGDVLFTIFAFTAVMFLLKKFAWGSLMGVMIKREENIANDIDAAEKEQDRSKRIARKAETIIKRSSRRSTSND